MTNEDQSYAVVHVRPTVVRSDGKIVRGHPAGTIAVAMQPDDDGKHAVGVAFRNPKDRWNGRLGRLIAVGRLRCQRKVRLALSPSLLSIGEDFRRTRLLLAALQFVEHVLAPDLVPEARMAVTDTGLRLAEGLERAKAKNASALPVKESSKNLSEGGRL